MSLDTNYLKDLLLKHNVAGISFSVIKDFKLNYAQTEGVVSAYSNSPVWPDTIFQAASISKTITALIIMQMYDKQELDIDKPVNDYLKSWRLPQNKWTKHTPVTIRHLLSHFSGINVPTYRGYIKGEPVPTLIDILEGTYPANSAAVRVETAVNEKFIYSTGSFAILQLLIEELTNRNFESVAQQNIFKPLNMQRTTFLSPLTAGYDINYACGHRSDGDVVAGDYFIYPEQAGSSLWTTPTDMAKLITHLQLILKTRKSGILSYEKLVEMLQPYKESFFGLGYALYHDKGEGFYFGHTGNTEGFRSMVIGHAGNGTGAVILINSDNADPVTKEVINAIAVEQGWEGFIW